MLTSRVTLFVTAVIVEHSLCKLSLCSPCDRTRNADAAVKAGRGNTYLGANEQERSLARSLCYGVSLRNFSLMASPCVRGQNIWPLVTSLFDTPCWFVMYLPVHRWVSLS